MGKLEGKVALITGAAGGIGRASSRLFVEEGVKGLVMADIWDEMGEHVEEELGPNAIYIHTDVSQESDIINAINLTIEKFGHLDIVFSNAGNPGPGGKIEIVPTKGFDNTIAIHLRAAFLFMKHSIPIMKKQGTGCFITTSSVAAFQQGMGGLPYSLSKSAIIQLTRIAAVELGVFGIRANSIAPGFIATGIFGTGFGLSRDGAEKLAKFWRNSPSNGQAIRRVGLPEDIANAALFLACDLSSFISGITLKVDGGLLSGRIPIDPEENEEIWFEMIKDLNLKDQRIMENIVQEGDENIIELLNYYKPYSILISVLLRRMQNIMRRKSHL